MLAQIAQVTEPADKLAAFTEFGAKLQASQKAFTTTTDAVNPIVELLNLFQEAMASVSYPAIAVTPIAIYRELEELR
jgi:hypothetical protein